MNVMEQDVRNVPTLTTEYAHIGLINSNGEEYTIIRKNPFDDESLKKFEEETDLGLITPIIVFEYTSSYENVILETFPDELGELMLKWVRTKDGLYRRLVVFKPAWFSVIDKDGTERRYSYGSGITIDGDWLKVV